METCLDDNQLLSWVDGTLSASERDSAEIHLGSCAACCELVAETAKLRETQATQGDGAIALAPSGHMRVGARVGRYELLSVLGRGGAGVVYEAQDPELHRHIAIKLLRSQAVEQDSDDSRARLLREARAMARVSHPHVVSIYDVGIWDGQVFVAMELVLGRTLRNVFRDEHIGSRARLDCLIEAGRGLCAAHAAGLVHRDFKPENVLVGNDGRVRVSDFGLAKSARGSEEPREINSKRALDVLSTVTLTGHMAGTPAYMAPEQFMDAPTDARVDQFAFGVVLYEALFGVRPFAGTSHAEIAKNVLDENIEARSPAALDAISGVDDAARQYRAIAVRALSREPDARFPSLEVLLEELERIRAKTKASRLEDTAVRAVEAIVPNRLAREDDGASSRRRRGILLASAAAFVGFSGLTLFVVSPFKNDAKVMTDMRSASQPSASPLSSALASSPNAPASAGSSSSAAYSAGASSVGGGHPPITTEPTTSERTTKRRARPTSVPARGPSRSNKPLGDRVENPF